MPAAELAAAALRAVCDPANLAFRSTADLPPLDGLIGQERAGRATRFGVAMRHAGYNLFVLGPSATGKSRSMRRVLDEVARAAPTPPDWCYVHNFADPYRPVALEVPAGRGRTLRAQMTRLVDECKARVPRAFEGDAFEQQKARIMEGLGARQKTEMAALERAVAARGFAIIRTPGGFGVAPARDGRPLSEEEFHALSDADRERTAAAGIELQKDVETTLRRLRAIEREGRDAHATLVEEVATAVIRPLVQEVHEQHAGNTGLARYLDQVEHDLIDHAEAFPGLGEPAPAMPFLPPRGAFLERYRVNVLVDRTGQQGAPVVVEDHPTFVNLCGRIDHHVHFGTLVTDFTLLKPGALHAANGGYLILEAKDVLGHVGAWPALKRALESRTIRIEEPLAELRLASGASLAPEPIPLDVKVVLLGSPLSYYLLHAYDEDFRALFKVKVDFDDSLPRSPAVEQLIARFVGDVCRERGLPHFAADAVAQLVEHCARLVAHQERLTSRLGTLMDVVCEAAYWAGTHGRELVGREDVRRAIAAGVQRANLVEDRLARLTAEDTIAIATAGTAVGQVNGMSVLALGDYAFGRPVRISARTFVGEPGVVDIEREVKLGGPLHSKGVMILGGFLAGRYARTRPLAMSATLTFEQQYSEVDGDSASSAEVYALLSSLAGIALRQDLAVTGAVSQKGRVQAVGGINEKVEGFFDLCRSRGLTGQQGVLIPGANVRHLMLREDVVDAVREGRFHVYPVATVDDGLALLTGRDAGEPDAAGRYPAGSVNGAVEQTIEANAALLAEVRGRGVTSPGSSSGSR